MKDRNNTVTNDKRKGQQNSNREQGWGNMPAEDMKNMDFRTDFQIGQYRIIKRLGSGANAEVFLAKDLNTGIEYAVKIFDDGDTHKKERNLLRSLNHKGIPKLKDCFPILNGYCIVMDYAKGVSLKNLFRKGRTESRQTEKRRTESKRMESIQPASIAEQLAEILIYLHTRPIPVIHGDLKPENIVVTENGEVRLLDFGSAFFLGDFLSEYYATNGYAAPEVFEGRCDQRSDLYSFGKVLIYLMCKKTPEVYGKKKDTGFFVRLGMKKKYARIAVKCIAEDPARRFSSAKELYKALLKCRKSSGLEGACKTVEQFFCEAGGGIIAIYGLFDYFIRNGKYGKYFVPAGCLMLVLRLVSESVRRKSAEGEFVVEYSIFLSGKR